MIAVRAGALELQYDLPNVATADDKARIWQFPARVFKADGKPEQLLNGAELEARLDVCLNAARLTRGSCGHWIFTWTAFRIDCDPQSVIKMVQAFDLRSADVRDGAAYQDPDAFRRARAESDVAVGEMTHNPVSLDAALGNRAKELISGTISVQFEP